LIAAAMEWRLSAPQSQVHRARDAVRFVPKTYRCAGMTVLVEWCDAYGWRRI